MRFIIFDNFEMHSKNLSNKYYKYINNNKLMPYLINYG